MNAHQLPTTMMATTAIAAAGDAATAMTIGGDGDGDDGDDDGDDDGAASP